jgi:dual specificity MAP kinase phosphatase
LNIPIDEVEVESLMSLDEKFMSLFKNDLEAPFLLKHFKRLFIGIVCSENKIKRKNFLFGNKSNLLEEIMIGKILTFYQTLLNNKFREVGVFIKGYNLIERNYGFLMLHEKIQEKLPIFPCDLFNNRIFIGNQKEAMNKEIISSLKITHIINATNHIPNIYEELGIKYLTIPIEDTDKNKISPYFKAAYDFIENALSEGTMENGDLKAKDNMESICDVLIKASNQFVKAEILQKAFKKLYFHTNNNNRVLIHCSLGVSRSSTIAIMFIMKKFSICFEEACNLVKFQKESSCPINSFLYELEELEKKKNCFD